MNAMQISNKEFLITVSDLLCSYVKKEVLPPKSGNKRPKMLYISKSACFTFELK